MLSYLIKRNLQLSDVARKKGQEEKRCPSSCQCRRGCIFLFVFVFVFVFEVRIDSHVGEVGFNGDVASVQREGQSADLFQEKIGGGACQENRRLEAKEEWLGTDLRARTEEQNNLRERPWKTKEEETSHGENGGEKSSHGGNDLLETLQLLGQEVRPVMGNV